MTERPILFNPEMIQAYRNGRKTQTRRIIKNPDYFGCTTGDCPHDLNSECDEAMKEFCPIGKIGDYLWIKETHFLYGFWNKTSKLKKSGKPKYKFIIDKEYGVKFPDNPPSPSDIKTKITEFGWFKRTSMFMPRWASRFRPQITNSRFQQIQDISEDDSIKEGITVQAPYIGIDSGGEAVESQTIDWAPSDYFMALWDSINKDRGYGWDLNPYVWVIDFEGIK